jgi:hypothetical protein
MPRFAIAITLAAMMAFPNVAAAACSWSVVASKNPHPHGNDLYGAFARSSTDAWAVGSSILTPLAEHWDGTSWSVSHTLKAHNYHDALLGIAADSATDVWAVGDTQLVSGEYVPLIEHRDATSWSVVANPGIGVFGGYLEGVVAFSPTDVWADGAIYTSHSGNAVTLIEHWNGSAWAIVPSPNVNQVFNTIYSLSATGPHDIWASGVFAPSDSNHNIHQTLIEHYNGTNWSIVASPNKNAFSNNTNAIAAITPTAALATGDYFDGTTFRTLAEGWNGSTWSIKPSPNHGANETDLFGMAAQSVTSAIAVGQYVPGTYAQTYAMKWNGAAWSSTTPLNVGPYDSFFNGAAAIPGTKNYWAVGGTTTVDFFTDKTLIEMYHC